MTEFLLGRRATIDDVASLAGVSRSAVSRTFTEGASVSRLTRERVEHAARSLGYRPNALARGLTKQHNQLIAFVSGYQDNLYDAAYHDKVLSGLQGAGFRILHVHIGSGVEVGRALLDALDIPVSAAVIAGGSIDEASITECIRLRTPVILCTGETDLPVVDCINSDNAGGTLAALNHVLSRGCRRISYIAGTPGMFSARERLEAFQVGMREHGLMPFSVDQVGFTYEGGIQAAQRIVSRFPFPDAILCGNDAIAFGVMTVLQGVGVRVPDEIAIIGFDDVPQASWPVFSLTTVRNPVSEKAQAICERVMCRTRNPECAKTNQRFTTQLILRATA